jgi:hypothetical protein
MSYSYIGQEVIVNSDELWPGLAFLGVGVLILAGYLAWNIKKKGIKRMAKEAEKVKSKPEEMERLSTITVPTLISHAATLAAMTFAALIIVVVLLLVEERNLEGLTCVVLYTVLGMMAISTVSYLFCLEQLTKILPPFRENERMIKLYKSSINLWLFAMILMVAAINLLMVLVNIYLVIAIGLVTAVVLIIYWKNVNEW